MSGDASKVGQAILDDLTDRRGFRQEWDQCDPATQDEIRATLGYIAIEAVRELDIAKSQADD